ncbi:hypothetical protein [Streptomyces sp. KL116D]|uniref:hypothetical protein n=1 Tax=Streptomyces sp. KL116D TaxID=3045152 RepID=UPI003557F8C5
MAHPLAELEGTFEVKVARRLLDGNVASALVGSAAVLAASPPDARSAVLRLTRDRWARDASWVRAASPARI